ncbi:hypothetical protein ILUMI_21518 [Ignelater luminosus]|uniref:Uncharacterized protein n=1 Tax=Ignelater luminosus TaxID=2038154 RepID=A0A8K0CHL0_IGNLU|nr:hypothetical protein ILUMI_21518 [Ignelater luminosus]
MSTFYHVEVRVRISLSSQLRLLAFPNRSRALEEEKLLENLNLQDAKGSRIPTDTGYFRNEDSTQFENKEIYRTTIGSLSYLAINTRPEFAESVSILSRRIVVTLLTKTGKKLKEVSNI